MFPDTLPTEVSPILFPWEKDSKAASCLSLFSSTSYFGTILSFPFVFFSSSSQFPVESSFIPLQYLAT